MTSDKQTVEPVAWGCFDGNGIDEHLVYRCRERAEQASVAFGGAPFDVRPLYTTPASPSLGERREEVARIIDPLGWSSFDDANSEADQWGEEYRPVRPDEHSTLKSSLVTADRIIALLSRPEGHQDGRGGG